jgi:hypothetical protein
MTSTLRKLNDSARLLGAGRLIQRRLDCRLLEARILELNEKVRAEGDLPAALIVDELNRIRDEITAAVT